MWTAAVANGWQIPTAVLPTFNFAVAAVTPIGNYYLPQGTDPLWDVDAPGAVPPPAVMFKAVLPRAGGGDAHRPS